MPSIELSPISEYLDEKQIQEIEKHLAEAGAGPLDIDEQAQSVALDNDVDDDLFAEVMDHLEVHDAACTVYVPPDFEEIFEIGENKVGSAHMLLLVLEELKEEFFFDSDEEEEEEFFEEEEEEEEVWLDESGGSAFDLKEKQLRALWKLLHLGAKTCVKRGVCMFLRP